MASIQPGALSDRAFEWLTQQLVTGALRPGQLISENELAATLGVSRSPVRRALQALATDGLVEIIPKRGTVVAQFSGRDATDLYAARILVEPEMVRLATENMTTADRDDVSAVIVRLRAAIGDDAAFFAATEAFWNRICSFCPNRTIRDVVQILWRRSIPFRGELLRLGGQQERVAHLFEPLLERIQAGNALGASDAHREMLQDVQQKLLTSQFLNFSAGVPAGGTFG